MHVSIETTIIIDSFEKTAWVGHYFYVMHVYFNVFVLEGQMDIKEYNIRSVRGIMEDLIKNITCCYWLSRVIHMKLKLDD